MDDDHDLRSAPGLSADYFGIAPELGSQRGGFEALPGPLTAPSTSRHARPCVLLLCEQMRPYEPLSDAFDLAGYDLRTERLADFEALARALDPDLLLLGACLGSEVRIRFVRWLRDSPDREIAQLPLLAMLPRHDSVQVLAAFSVGVDDLIFADQPMEAWLYRARGLLIDLRRPWPLHGLINHEGRVRHCVAQLLIPSRAEGIDAGLRDLLLFHDEAVRTLARAIMAMRGTPDGRHSQVTMPPD